MKKQTTPYDKDHFFWDVINEAIALRQHATQEELNRLSFSQLDAFDINSCIYGQAARNCFSHRAAELISMCCPRYFYQSAVSRHNEIDDVIESANGTSVDDFIQGRTQFFSILARRESTLYFSAIEAYITLPGAKNKSLIRYLRGETEKLDICIF